MPDFGKQVRSALEGVVRSALASVEQHVDQLSIAVAAQATDLARLRGEFEDLAELARRMEADTASGFGQIAARLDNDFGQIAARLDNDFGQVAARLDNDFGQVAARLDNDFGQVAARLDNEFGQIAARLDNEFVQIAARLDNGFGQIVGRLDNDFGTLVAFVRRLDEDLANGLASLNADVAQGFGQIAARLEGDLVQLTNTVHDVSAFIRFSTGTIAKLVLDQTDWADHLRDLHRELYAGSLVAQASGAAEPSDRGVPVLRPLAEAKIPVEVLAVIGAEGWAAERALSIAVQPVVTEAALPSLIQGMRAGRPRGGKPLPLVWALPPSLVSLLSTEESSQIFGLLGSIAQVRDVAAPDGCWRLILGRTRPEGFALALRWSLTALEEFYFRLRPVFDEALNRFALHAAFHAIDIPHRRDDLGDWKKSVSELVQSLATKDGAVFGIVLPPNFADEPALIAESVAHVRGTLHEVGSERTLAFQWVRGNIPIGLSSKIIEFAESNGIPIDCTPVARGAAESRLAAYAELVPYRPLSFDLRLPALGGAAREVFVVARRSGRQFTLTNGLDRSSKVGLGSFLDGEFERAVRRLAPVLDRGARMQFEAQANLDQTLMSLWPDYFVFNWSAPVSARLCLFEFDAAELVSNDSPLARLQRAQSAAQSDERYLPADDFFELTNAVAAHPPPTDAQERDNQIAEHAYLSARTQLTADAERLTTWMPAALGVTLELGSGSGAMARAVATRAELYVGLDLTTQQAHLLGPMKGAGIVADMHRLPFSDGSFDTIIADNVIEHGHDPVQVLREVYRVLRRAGSAFLVIPHDYYTSQFQNVAHLWKADEESVRLAIEASNFIIARQETVNLRELGVPGAYPSSGGMTGLWHLQKAAPDSAHRSRCSRSAVSADASTT